MLAGVFMVPSSYCSLVAEGKSELFSYNHSVNPGIPKPLPVKQKARYTSARLVESVPWLDHCASNH